MDQPNIFAKGQSENGKYQLEKFITHLGASVHAGHYVCHIRKGKDWIYFNDAKVAQCPTPPFGKGFIYLFGQQQQEWYIYFNYFNSHQKT